MGRTKYLDGRSAGHPRRRMRFLRVFQARCQLVLNLANHLGRHAFPVPLQEFSRRGRILLRELPECPGQRFVDYIVAVGNQQCADLERVITTFVALL